MALQGFVQQPKLVEIDSILRCLSLDDGTVDIVVYSAYDLREFWTINIKLDWLDEIMARLHEGLPAQTPELKVTARCSN